MKSYLEQKARELYKGKEIFSGRMAFDFVPYTDPETGEEKVIITEFHASDGVPWQMNRSDFNKGDIVSQMSQKHFTEQKYSRKKIDSFIEAYDYINAIIQKLSDQGEKKETEEILDLLERYWEPSWAKLIVWYKKEHPMLTQEEVDLVMESIKEMYVDDIYEGKEENWKISVLSSDKEPQLSFIPPEYQASSYTYDKNSRKLTIANPDDNSTSRLSDWVILRPRTSYGQKGILILHKSEVETLFNNSNQNTNIPDLVKYKTPYSNTHLTQVLVPANGAKNIVENYRDRPSFIRMNTKVTVIRKNDGSYQVIFDSTNFNQVSLLDDRPGRGDNEPAWVKVDFQGRKKVSTPPRELMRKCLRAAEKTVENLASFVDPESDNDIEVDIN